MYSTPAASSQRPISYSHCYSTSEHTSSFSSRLSNLSTSVSCFSATGTVAASFFLVDVKMEHAGCTALGLTEILYKLLIRLILLPNFNDDLSKAAIFAVATELWDKLKRPFRKTQMYSFKNIEKFIRRLRAHLLRVARYWQGKFPLPNFSQLSTGYSHFGWLVWCLSAI